MEKICIHCYVSGKVQGVFYRVTTQEQAQKLGLNGWVKNLADGRVEVMICGIESKVQELINWLWIGPEYAVVDDVNCQEITCYDSSFTEFLVD